MSKIETAEIVAWLRSVSGASSPAFAKPSVIADTIETLTRRLAEVTAERDAAVAGINMATATPAVQKAMQRYYDRSEELLTARAEKAEAALAEAEQMTIAAARGLIGGHKATVEDYEAALRVAREALADIRESWPQDAKDLAKAAIDTIDALIPKPEESPDVD
jgi:hypothetical protein